MLFFPRIHYYANSLRPSVKTFSFRYYFRICLSIKYCSLEACCAGGFSSRIGLSFCKFRIGIYPSLVLIGRDSVRPVAGRHRGQALAENVWVGVSLLPLGCRSLWPSPHPPGPQFTACHGPGPNQYLVGCRATPSTVFRSMAPLVRGRPLPAASPTNPCRPRDLTHYTYLNHPPIVHCYQGGSASTH